MLPHNPRSSLELSGANPRGGAISEDDKNALKARGWRARREYLRKINVGQDSTAESAILPRRIAGSRLLNSSELRG